MTTIGRQVSFAQLFATFRVVEVPIIQRDYAQGRLDQGELRKEFLAALKSALDAEDSEFRQPLDLDFVYGSAFRRNGAAAEDGFAPLDGQQRLTTLFLLHWYLAWIDEQGEDFGSRFVDERRSRLVYEVRPSSHDFFNQLVVNLPTERPAAIESLQSVIEDSSWFFRSWKNDPTIRSALTMLEAIHGLFRDTHGFYARLTDPIRPRITFQLLELRDFGLSDDLYIKMNARGKPLTPFETFKARLEQHLDELVPNETRILAGRKVSVREYFSHQMDTTWADLFWGRRNRQTNLYDAELMRLIKAVALVSVDLNAGTATKVIAELRAPGGSISFAKLFELGALNHHMLSTLEAVLDYWCEQNLDDEGADQRSSYGSKAAFVAATSGQLSYPELVKFGSFCIFVHSHPSPSNRSGFAEWSRVVWNLVENSEIERPTEYIDACKSIRELAVHSDDILEHLASGAEIKGFNRQQVREERIKAEMVLRSNSWAERLREAERHGYFNGQIEFLLSFSGALERWLRAKAVAWSDDEDRQIQERFSDYFTRAKRVFDAGGLRKFEDFVWERALLSLGDYTFYHGSNKCLLDNKVGAGDKRPTWKLLLRGHLSDSEAEKKRSLVAELLDKIEIDKGVVASLQAVMGAEAIEEPWRRMLVEMPQMIAYCGQRMFRLRPDGAVYLISKVRTTSEHVELWTYYLLHGAIAEMKARGELVPFNLHYVSVAGGEWYMPFIAVKWSGGPVEGKIEFGNGQYQLKLSCGDAESARFFAQRLGLGFVIKETDNAIDLSVTKEQVVSALSTVVTAARDYGNRSGAAAATS